jgi:hypothetical protein
MMAALCKDGGRQANQVVAHVHMYMPLEWVMYAGVYLRNEWSEGRRPHSSAFFAMADAPVTRNYSSSSLSDESVGRILTLGR